MKWLSITNEADKMTLSQRHEIMNKMILFCNPWEDDPALNDEILESLRDVIMEGGVWRPRGDYTYLTLWYEQMYLFWIDGLDKPEKEFEDKMEDILREVCPDLFQK